MSRTIRNDYNFNVGGVCAKVPITFYEGTIDLDTLWPNGVDGLDSGLFGNMWCSGANYPSNPGRQIEPDHTFSTGNRGIDSPQQDIIRTKCFMGEKAKRTGSNFNTDREILCPVTNEISRSLVNIIQGANANYVRAGYPVFEINCGDTLSSLNKCSRYKPDPPAGWVDHDHINNQESSHCSLDEITAGTNVQVDGAKGCRYGYVKDWDTQIGNNNIDNNLSGDNKNVPGTYWGYPRYFPAHPGGEIPQLLIDTGPIGPSPIGALAEAIAQATGAPSGRVTSPQTYTYNENKIPIKRMECCLHKKIILDPNAGRSTHSTRDATPPLPSTHPPHTAESDTTHPTHSSGAIQFSVSSLTLPDQNVRAGADGQIALGSTCDPDATEHSQMCEIGTMCATSSGISTCEPCYPGCATCDTPNDNMACMTCTSGDPIYDDSDNDGGGRCWNNTLTFITSDPFNQEDIDNCPIDKNKLNQITVTPGGGTEGGDISDDAINAYTLSSRMCGATNDYTQGTLTWEEKRGTPPYWCSYNILNGTEAHPNPTAEPGTTPSPQNFYGHSFDINNFDRYWSLLNDNLCNEWLALDGSVASSGASNEYRKSNLAQYLAPFYLWISYDLAHNTSLKPTNTEPGRDELDISRSDFITPDPGSPDSHCVSGIPCFDISDDYGKYMNILSHDRAAEFLKYSSDPDRSEFNKNMVTFCNRRDIFNFKDYTIDGNRHYNSALEDRYNKFCSCYWDKDNDNTPPDQFDKIHAAIINFFENEETATGGQMIASYRDNLQLDLANQCWFNNCIANDHFGSPYKPGTQSDEPTVPQASDGNPSGCPNQCLAIAQATCILDNQGTIEAGDINFDCQAESDCSSDSSLSNPTVQTVSDMGDLLDVSHEGSVDVGEPGDNPENNPRGSIDSKNIFFLILIVIIIIIGIVLF